MKRYIDLSRTLTDKMPVYPGDPKPELKTIATVEKDGYSDQKVITGMHISTHIDAPSHGFKGMKNIDEFPVDKFIGRAWVLDARNKTQVDESLFLSIQDQFQDDDCLLIRTGFEEIFGTEKYYNEFPAMTESFAKILVERSAKIVAFDTSSPDYPPYNVHRILLSNEVLIIENLCNLEALPLGKPFEIYALPWKIDAAGAPVRVVASV
ncbi:MAG: cyclase family protein [Hyphomicrobiales bacterium]